MEDGYSTYAHFQTAITTGGNFELCGTIVVVSKLHKTNPFCQFKLHVKESELNFNIKNNVQKPNDFEKIFLPLETV